MESSGPVTVMAVVPELVKVMLLVVMLPEYTVLKLTLVGGTLAIGPVTDCEATRDELPLKFVSPEYTAVSVLVPVVANAMPQLPVPAFSGALHVSDVLAVTVTLPVGTVAPVTWNETICPGSAGFGEFDVIEVALPALAMLIEPTPLLLL